MIFGVIMTAACLALCAGFYLHRKNLNRNIAKLSEQIHMIMHGYDSYDLHVFKEGEFYILQNEVQKMTLRIREQNSALAKDKQYLADSLADIAHQLRTPLTSANLILSFLEKNPQVRELEELLVRMDWLITSLLKISRLDAGVVAFQRETVNVSGLIESALRPLAIPMELRGIDIQTDIPKDAAIRGDLGWLSEAVQNILKNCQESAGNNGVIQITCTENNLYTEVTIHDSGAGFEPEDLPRLFDRFYRGKNDNAAGYGIGLALCKMIVTRQGGTVTAKNHPQGGAVFMMRFNH
jgi:hypothetical protein